MRLISSGMRRLKLRSPDFHVRRRQAQLGGHCSARQGGIGIAVEQHPIGLLGFQHRLERLHDPGGLRGMRRRADPQIVIGSRYVQFLEEHVAHRGVVVLAGMHDAMDDRGPHRPPRGKWRPL